MNYTDFITMGDTEPTPIQLDIILRTPTNKEWWGSYARAQKRFHATGNKPSIFPFLAYYRVYDNQQERIDHGNIKYRNIIGTHEGAQSAALDTLDKTFNRIKSSIVSVPGTKFVTIAVHGNDLGQRETGGKPNPMIVCDELNAMIGKLMISKPIIAHQYSYAREQRNKFHEQYMKLAEKFHTIPDSTIQFSYRHEPGLECAWEVQTS